RRMEGRRTRARAHAAPECVPARRERLLTCGRAAVCGRDHDPRNRSADVPDQRGARGQAPARRPFGGTDGGAAVSLVYLGALLISLAGIVLLDVRHRLFLGRDAVRALIVLAIGVAFLLLWDAAGIALGIFFRADGPFS